MNKGLQGDIFGKKGQSVIGQHWPCPDCEDGNEENKQLTFDLFHIVAWEPASLFP